jgi:hypothetical protein
MGFLQRCVRRSVLFISLSLPLWSKHGHKAGMGQASPPPPSWAMQGGAVCKGRTLRAHQAVLAQLLRLVPLGGVARGEGFVGKAAHGAGQACRGGAAQACACRRACGVRFDRLSVLQTLCGLAFENKGYGLSERVGGWMVGVVLGGFNEFEPSMRAGPWSGAGHRSRGAPGLRMPMRVQV